MADVTPYISVLSLVDCPVCKVTKKAAEIFIGDTYSFTSCSSCIRERSRNLTIEIPTESYTNNMDALADAIDESPPDGKKRALLDILDRRAT